MRSRSLDASIALVRRVLEKWGSGSVHEGKLRWALRELKILRRGGKNYRKRLCRVVAILSEIIHDHFRGGKK
jgi:hypothetical protein